MSNLDNKAEARASFTDIIRKKPVLEPLADSQVMQGVNTFQNLALEYALHKLERARQEGYLSTAYNRSSILALAEDRQYSPRKAAPSRGQIRIRSGRRRRRNRRRRDRGRRSRDRAGGDGKPSGSVTRGGAERRRRFVRERGRRRGVLRRAVHPSSTM